MQQFLAAVGGLFDRTGRTALHLTYQTRHVMHQQHFTLLSLLSSSSTFITPVSSTTSINGGINKQTLTVWIIPCLVDIQVSTQVRRKFVPQVHLLCVRKPAAVSASRQEVFAWTHVSVSVLLELVVWKPLCWIHPMVCLVVST